MIELLKQQSPIKDRAYERYLDDRIIIINEDITDDVIERVVMPILKFNQIDDKKEKKEKDFKRDDEENIIKIYINSFGGSVYDGLSVVSAIESSKTPVYIYGAGKIMSMGFTIMCSGHKRFMQKYGTLMYHDVQHYLGYDSTSGHKMSIEEGERLRDMIDKMIIKRTKLTQEILDKPKISHPHNWYIDSQKALELEIAHELF